MSCTEVMYQPYSPYFPYQRSAAAAAAAAVGSCGGPPPGIAAAAQAACLDYKVAADAQYLSANCVVFTYYSGDISSVVDEHFSRALSQPSSYEAACKTGAPFASFCPDTPPMSQRNFPASFWNCNQQTSASNSPIMAGNSLTGGASPGDLYPADPYHPHHPHHPHHHHHHHHHHHAAAASANAAALHASLQNDPWHYALTAPQTAPYRSSAMHELAYSAAAAAGGSHRFGTQQYGSLLLQPSVRSSRLTPVSATCTALDKTADAWAAAAAAPGRYHHEQLAGNIAGHVDGNYGGAHYGSMGAAAAAMTGN
ncbi:unnamed protein product, partial [Ixodes hexagonus]